MKLRQNLAALSFPGLFVVLTGCVCAMGFRPVVSYFSFQLLDEELLTGRLLESVLYLHAQPPMLNLLLGLLIKLSLASGMALRWLVFGCNVAVGLAAVFAYRQFSSRFLGGGARSTLFMLCLVLNPFLYVQLFQYFYTLPELAGLGMLAALAWRCLTRPTLAVFAVFCLTLLLLTLTRALYHCLFAAALTLYLVWALPQNLSRSARRRSYAWLAAAACVLYMLWPAKNWLQFGFFGSSSWQGYNLARGLSLARPPLYDLYQAEGDPAYVKAAADEARQQVPERYQEIPALSEPLKKQGWTNWNHYSVIEYSKTLGREAAESMARHPEALLKKARINYGYFASYEGRAPYQGDFIQTEQLGAPWRWWSRIYELIVYQYFGQNSQLSAISGFMFLFPCVMLLAGFRIAKKWRSQPAEARFALFLMLCVAWVLFAVVIVDGAEGNRIRYPVTPYILLLFFWLLEPQKNTPCS